MGFLFLVSALTELDQQNVMFLIQKAAKWEELCSLHFFQSTCVDQYSAVRDSSLHQSLLVPWLFETSSFFLHCLSFHLFCDLLLSHSLSNFIFKAVCLKLLWHCLLGGIWNLAKLQFYFLPSWFNSELSSISFFSLWNDLLLNFFLSKSAIRHLRAQEVAVSCFFSFYTTNCVV